jgi:enamine deaminase RidA (YjgF/YER057c/UK114 family)
MTLTALQPPGWPAPRGYSNGMMGRGRVVLVGGQVGWDAEGRFPQGLVPQVRQALLNILAVLREAGGGPEHIGRLTWYVTDMEEYRASLKELGPVYREVMGRNFPAMALVQVLALVEREARVEIEATAILPDQASG